MTPGETDQTLDIRPAPTRMRAAYRGHVIADSNGVLILKQGSRTPVAYFPKGDVELGYFARSGQARHCPTKGDSACYTLTLDGDVLENVAWIHEDPLPAAVQLSERMAFQAHRIEVYGVSAETAPDDRFTDVDSIVQHTDSGAGQSQQPHWPSNVTPRADRES